MAVCVLQWFEQHVGGLRCATTPLYSFAYVAYSDFLSIIHMSFNWKPPGQAELYIYSKLHNKVPSQLLRCISAIVAESYTQMQSEIQWPDVFCSSLC